MAVRNHAALAADTLAAVEQEVARLRTLEDVVRWAAAYRPPRAIVDVVAQDEFTNDVVVARAPLWLVFDTT